MPSCEEDGGFDTEATVFSAGRRNGEPQSDVAIWVCTPFFVGKLVHHPKQFRKMRCCFFLRDMYDMVINICFFGRASCYI